MERKISVTLSYEQAEMICNLLYNQKTEFHKEIVIARKQGMHQKVDELWDLKEIAEDAFEIFDVALDFEQ